jgi:hypothetical protein
VTRCTLIMALLLDYGWFTGAIYAVLATIALYLLRVNQLLKGTPDEIRKLSGSRWTAAQLKETYERLQKSPINYTDKLPPKLERRYVVVGGSGWYHAAVSTWEPRLDG